MDEPLTDDDLEELCTRRLDHARFPRLFVEASYVKTRVNGHARFETIVGLVGQRADDRFEILGFDVGDSEDSEFWSRILFVLRIRGLRGLREVVTDEEHGGLSEAVSAVFPGARLSARDRDGDVDLREEKIGERARPSISMPSGRRADASPGASPRPGGDFLRGWSDHHN